MSESKYSARLPQKHQCEPNEIISGLSRIKVPQKFFMFANIDELSSVVFEMFTGGPLVLD